MIPVQTQIDQMAPRGDRLCHAALGKKFTVRSGKTSVTGTIVEARVAEWRTGYTRSGSRKVQGIFEVVLDSGLGKYVFKVATLPV